MKTSIVNVIKSTRYILLYFIIWLTHYVKESMWSNLSGLVESQARCVGKGIEGERS